MNIIYYYNLSLNDANYYNLFINDANYCNLFLDFPSAFSSGPEPVTGYIGGSVRLSVDISNFKPSPQIAWLYRGSSQLLGTNPKYTVLPQGVIQISNLGDENKGEIQAIARNTVSNARMLGKFVAVNVLPGLHFYFHFLCCFFLLLFPFL